MTTANSCSASLNVHTTAIWAIIEIYSDQGLLSRIRSELRNAGITSSSYKDIDKLISIPLLESVYAEVMRLRVEVQAVFCSDREEIRVNEWIFPKKSLVLVPTGAAHRDEDSWNTKDGKHPLDKFWADRFLAYPNDPQSGPLRRNVTDHAKPKGSPNIHGNITNKPRFVKSGLSDMWIPFGVGERTCPGRGFAKRQIIAFCATAVLEFDLEILSTERDFETSPSFYGLGTVRPLRHIPFRVRRRKV